MRNPGKKAGMRQKKEREREKSPIPGRRCGFQMTLGVVFLFDCYYYVLTSGHIWFFLVCFGGPRVIASGKIFNTQEKNTFHTSLNHLFINNVNRGRGNSVMSENSF